MATEAETQHRLTRAQVLRRVLADGAWHTADELTRKVGWRFGAAIFLVRRGEDGRPPWHIEGECLNDAKSMWRYRYVGRAEAPPRRSQTWQARALKAEQRVRELEAELRRASA